VPAKLGLLRKEGLGKDKDLRTRTDQFKRLFPFPLGALLKYRHFYKSGKKKKKKLLDLSNYNGKGIFTLLNADHWLFKNHILSSLLHESVYAANS